MLNDLKIRNKLAAILVAPVLALLVLASVGVRQRNDTAARASRDLDLVKVFDATTKLMVAVNIESTYSVAVVSKFEDGSRVPDKAFSASLTKARKATDDAFGKLDIAVEGLGLSNVAEPTRTSFDTVRQNFSDKDEKFDFRIGSTRNTVDSANDGWADVAGVYDTYASSITLFAKQMAGESTSPEVAPPLQNYGLFLDYLAAESKLNNQLIGLARQGDWAPPAGSGGQSVDIKTERANALTTLVTAIEGFSAARSLLAGSTSYNLGGDAQLSDVLGQGGDNLANLQLVDREGATISGLDGLKGYVGEVSGSPSQDGGPGGPIPIKPMTDAKNSQERVGWVVTIAGRRLASAQPFADQLTADLNTRHSNSQRAAQLFILFAGLVILVAVVLAIWVARSITQRVNKLTAAAEKLSHEQLPRLVDSLKNPAEDDVGYLASSFTDIEVSGSDEIGNLADAFNRIQAVAVEVATEQAQLLRKGIGDMFVNLARRNQGLLDRQIEFIDQLEAAEEDPDQLENLFRLDHLATRMRRNAESLLVLAGAEPNRRRGKPVPLADVVRAAVGEVEDFARIDMLQFDEVLVASNAALDIAHLLSELMENAANFSPPDSRVEVVGHRTKAEGYVISVADHGIGMSPEQLTESNDLLSRPPLVGLALSRSLGFIVIGRLAARFGIAVRLMPSPSGGTTAMVSLPPSLITEQPRSSGPGVLETEGAPPEPVTPREDATPTRSVEPTAPTGQPAARRPLKTRKAAEPAAAPVEASTPAPTRSAPAPQEPAATPAAAASTAAPAATSSGLKKRVPRAAGGERAVPGGDGERSTAQNRRSPDEVRSMLSRFQSGVQRGRGDEAAPDVTEDASS